MGKMKTAGKKNDEDQADDPDISKTEDIANASNGQPLFANFGQEDWALVLLRMELYLLLNAFPKDCDDKDRKIHVSNLAFYFNKYWGKNFSGQTYGMKDDGEIIRKLIKDTIEVNDTDIVLSKLQADLEAPDVF